MKQEFEFILYYSYKSYNFKSLYFEKYPCNYQCHGYFFVLLFLTTDSTLVPRIWDT